MLLSSLTPGGIDLPVQPFAVPVLTYHHVTLSGGPLSISVENFEAQMSWLAHNGYVTLSSEEFANFLNGTPAPAKSVVLTFDDGYLDNFHHAYPILRRFGLNAIMFLITVRIHDGRLRESSDANRTHEECEKLLRARRADDVTVRWSEIELMRSHGTFEFHSHTHSHLRWDRLCEDRSQRRDYLRADVERSRVLLARRLGVHSKHLCWPEGYFDADYIQVARDEGFEYLYTTHNRRRNTPLSDPSEIHRLVDNGKD